MNIDQFSNTLNKVKTPLSLIGLVLLLFAYLMDKVLSLDIFSTMNESLTENFLSKVVGYINSFALTSLILGVLCYIISLAIKREGQNETD